MYPSKTAASEQQKLLAFSQGVFGSTQWGYVTEDGAFAGVLNTALVGAGSAVQGSGDGNGPFLATPTDAAAGSWARTYGGAGTGTTPMRFALGDHAWVFAAFMKAGTAVDANMVGGMGDYTTFANVVLGFNGAASATKYAFTINGASGVSTVSTSTLAWSLLKAWRTGVGGSTYFQVGSEDPVLLSGTPYWSAGGIFMIGCTNGAGGSAIRSWHTKLPFWAFPTGT